MFRTKLTAILFLMLMFTGCKQVNSNKNIKDTTSVYARVIQKDKIRAAYINYPPACMKNTKTGEMSGIFVEVLEKACENLGLELEWTEEVGWASQIEGLDSNRYDIVGSPVWANVVRGTKTTMSIPVYYSGIGMYVRAGDKRFDNDWSKINNPDVKVGVIDGETSSIIASQDFPEAKKHSSIQLTDISQKFLDLTSQKCDVVFAEPYYAYEYEKNNSGTIKNIASESPIRLFGNCYMFRKGEFQMKHMLDVAIQDLINSGYVEKIISKYEPAPNLFYRVAKPYSVNK
ncbi:substrate-binding periplasmic protein [Kordia jejudonensis]|uniref:substrate-binding periplasmic protein n=1 Tax=Kordia jejudonensis TaxID=1348245 RepID=UPI0006294B8D|nr:transporter substrate-binding domain-containing protein [Kordia jejudonensis]